MLWSTVQKAGSPLQSNSYSVTPIRCQRFPFLEPIYTVPASASHIFTRELFLGQMASSV